MPEVYIYLKADGRPTDAIAEATCVLHRTTDDAGNLVREQRTEFAGPRTERDLTDDERRKAVEEFHAVLSTPRRWRDKGRELLASVACIRPRVEAAWKAHAERNEAAGKYFDDVYGTYFMLIAFALENYCKAILLQRGLVVDPAARELPKALKTHNLPVLLAKVGIKVDLWNQGLLERLTRTSRWAGRYPIPAKADELGRSHAIGLLLGLYTIDDLRDLDRLVEGVEAAVDRALGPDE